MGKGENRLRPRLAMPVSRLASGNRRQWIRPMALFGTFDTVRAQAQNTPGFAAAFAYVAEILREGSAARTRLRGIAAGSAQKIDLGVDYGLNEEELGQVSQTLSDTGIPGLDAASFDPTILAKLDFEQMVEVLPVVLDAMGLELGDLEAMIPPVSVRSAWIPPSMVTRSNESSGLGRCERESLAGREYRARVAGAGTVASRMKRRNGAQRASITGTPRAMIGMRIAIAASLFSDAITLRAARL